MSDTGKRFYVVIGLGHHSEHKFSSITAYTDEDSEKVVMEIKEKVLISAWRVPAPSVYIEDEHTQAAHKILSESCERWRRSLLIDGPKNHLHTNECVSVAVLLREKAQ